jgi:hypothetical protein
MLLELLHGDLPKVTFALPAFELGRRFFYLELVLFYENLSQGSFELEVAQLTCALGTTSLGSLVKHAHLGADLERHREVAAESNKGSNSNCLVFQANLSKCICFSLQTGTRPRVSLEN